MKKILQINKKFFHPTPIAPQPVILIKLKCAKCNHINNTNIKEQQLKAYKDSKRKFTLPNTVNCVSCSKKLSVSYDEPTNKTATNHTYKAYTKFLE